MIYQPRRPPRHERIVIRGLEHHLSSWGPPSESPVLLLHGFLDSGASFQFLVDCLPDSLSLVAPDWRGFGRSAWQPGGYWFPDYLADLDELLAQLSPAQPAQLVGHSMGANVACLYAGLRPERVRRLVNLEGLGLPRTSPEQAPGRYRQWLDQQREPPEFASYSSFEEFSASLRRRNPRLTLERAEFIARSWAAQTETGQVVARADPRHKLVNPVLYQRDEVEACWRHIRAPMLLVLGAQSEIHQRLATVGGVEPFKACFSDLRLQTLADTGHMMHHERPEELARCIEAFLELA